MTKSPTAAPSGLRIIHAMVFLGFASATLAGTHLELLQLWRVATQPYHAGTAPHAIACASGIVAALGALTLIARIGLGKGAPLWLSVLLLAAFAGSLTVLLQTPANRTVPGANVKALERAKELHARLNDALQTTGDVPSEPAALALAGETPFFKRPFVPLSWHVAKVDRTDALPDGAEPGWLLLRTTIDRSMFVLTAVGIDEDGAPSLLRNEGKPIEYRGAYNPDTGL